jgi:Ca-activated chloride channel family protein
MRRRSVVISLFVAGLLSSCAVWMAAQDNEQESSVIHVVVNMVQLNVAVTDNRGNYVTGLKPSDFEVAEDGIPETIATFEQGSGSQRNVAGDEPKVDPSISAGSPPTEVGEKFVAGSGEGSSRPGLTQGMNSLVSGANVFILFDTSNYMYRGRSFVFAQDAISQFIRSLDLAHRIAFYAYSRDLYRAASLTSDRSQILQRVRQTTNGDNSALYNALLLTLKDASQFTGRRVVVVFSNGPDNASMVAPEDVDELAQSQGIPIYMISTHEARLDRATAAVFSRMSANTGGEVYFAKSWREEQQAFDSIRNDLANLYLLSYYPKPNPNRGWRRIRVRLVNRKYRKYRLRTRDGYRPLASSIFSEVPPAR